MRTLKSYAIAAFSAGVALLLTLATAPARQKSPYLLLTLGVMIAASQGLGSGLVATLLGAAGGLYFLIPPVGSFRISGPDDLVPLLLFCLVGCAITWIARGLDVSRKGLLAANETLRESEMQFRNLANAIPQLCWMANADGWIFWYNQRWYDYTGATPEQMEGWGWQSVHDPEELAKVLERWKASIATGEPFDMVFPLRGADAAFRPFLTRVMPVRSLDGKVARWFGTNTDISEQRKTEEELRRSSDRERARAVELQAIMDAMPVAAFVARDPECREMTGNRMSYELLRLPMGSNLSKSAPEGRMPNTFRAMRDGREIPPYELPVQKAAATAQAVQDYEFDLEFQDGTRRNLVGNAVPLINGGGRSQGSVGIFTDITERKKAEEALQHQREWLRVTLSSIGDAVLATDAAGKVTFFNPVAVQLTGWTEEQAIGRPFQDVFRIINEQTREPAPDIVGRVLREACVVALANHTALVARGGREIPVEDSAAPILGAAGNLLGVVLVFHDVTEKRRAQEAVHRSEGRLRAALKASHTGTLHRDLRTGEVEPDENCARLFGLPSGRALQSEEFLDLVHPDDRAAVAADIQRCAGAGVDFERDFRVVWADGSVHWLVDRGMTYRDDQGKPAYVIGACAEITERKLAEENLRAAQKLESVGMLAGGIAHDFNNLLVGVIGNTSLAQEMLPAGHPGAEMLEMVIKAGEQAAHLTRQMLAYAGKGRFFVEPLDLSDLIPEMIGLVRPSIAKKIALHIDLEPGLPRIQADRGQVQQVFMNLVLNAAEAIGSDAGMVGAKASVREINEQHTRTITGTELRPGKYVCLEVRDTGCGMDEATRAKIFEPFFSTKFQGRGLGLAAVSGIVRSHRGAITVDSTLGQGSCFTVLLPVAEAAASESEVVARSAALHGSGTILVVDDEEVVRGMAKRTLERYGYKVLEADSGLAAIDVFKRHPGDIALVVLDLSMPQMGGEEVLPELRKIRPNVKFLVSSGYSEAETMRLFEGQHVVEFLQKPFTSKRLAEKVKQAME